MRPVAHPLHILSPFTPLTRTIVVAQPRTRISLIAIHFRNDENGHAATSDTYE